jgi:hypothetical protein
VEVEVPLQQRPRLDLGGPFLFDEERLAGVDQRLDDAAHQVLTRREVVVQRGLGDPEQVGDLLQARLLHALLREQLAGGRLDALLGVRCHDQQPNLLNDR